MIKASFGCRQLIAAGGIADGRGIAATLAVGAQAASLGTRFLATDEMGIDASWKTRIVDASALDAIKVLHAERVLASFNIPQIGPLAAPRALRTPLIDQLEAEPESVDPSIIGPRVVNAIRAGGRQEFLPFAGQSAALIHDVVPVAELVRRLVEETRMALHKANSAVIQS